MINLITLITLFNIVGLFLLGLFLYETRPRLKGEEFSKIWVDSNRTLTLFAQLVLGVGTGFTLSSLIMFVCWFFSL